MGPSKKNFGKNDICNSRRHVFRKCYLLELYRQNLFEMSYNVFQKKMFGDFLLGFDTIITIKFILCTVL